MDLSELDRVKADLAEVQREYEACTRELVAMRASGPELMQWELERASFCNKIKRLGAELRDKVQAVASLEGQLRIRDVELLNLRAKVSALETAAKEWKAYCDGLESQIKRLRVTAKRKPRQAPDPKPERRRVNAPGWARLIGS